MSYRCIVSFVTGFAKWVLLVLPAIKQNEFCIVPSFESAWNFEDIFLSNVSPFWFWLALVTNLFACWILMPLGNRLYLLNDAIVSLNILCVSSIDSAVDKRFFSSSNTVFISLACRFVNCTVWLLSPLRPHAWVVTSTSSLSSDALTTLTWMLGATVTPMNKRIMPRVTNFLNIGESSLIIL